MRIKSNKTKTRISRKSKMAATLDDSISYGLKETLNHVLKREKFPVIVRVCEDFINTTMGGRAVMHAGEELLITGRQTVELGRVRVLDVLDEEAARKAHNDDFVAERGMFVGEEYLLPIKVPCKLKFVQRPGKRRRYATVSQLIEDMPRRLRVNEDVMSVPPGGAGHNTLVPRGTVLNLKRVFTCEGVQNLQCTFGTQNVSFKESMRVNFTAVDDDSEYTLAYIQKSNILPSVFEFICPKQSEVVHFENDIASSTLTTVEGPLELIAIIQANVLVCWKREQKVKSYSTMIIPVSLGNTIAIQQRKFDDANFKVGYIDKRFCDCSGSDFIETGIYLIDPNQMGVGYLKSPKFYVYVGGWQQIRTPKKGIRYNVSSDEGSEDDGDDNYMDISPPIPERVPIHGIPENQMQDQKKRIKRKKTMFHSIHEDIRKFFLKKHDIKDIIHLNNGANAKHKAEKHTTVFKHHLPPALPSEQDSDSGDEYNYPDMDGVMAEIPKPTPRPRQQLPTDKSNGNRSDDSDSPGDYEIPELPTENTPKISASARSRQPPPRTTRSIYQRKAPPLPKPETPLSPRTKASSSSGSVESRSPDSPDLYYSPVNPFENNEFADSSPNDQQKSEYIKFSKRDMINILQADQTEEDFYKLTVIQLSHLMYYCSLKHIATVCYDHSLDGEFFRGMDLEIILTDEPFNAVSMHVTKFRRIMSGWRPTLE
ncbi:uncharacterized protein LOC128212950 [Mya arenaria]|uniref:uncharacterized protein LOC128212950 n=1 Tax=Mya arenaria TaxID=6604 RepID=UPI0022E568F7|nr:uncharacterized protein LOC128212950 [Mya arenaria]